MNITGTESKREAVVEYMTQHEENLPEDYLEKSNLGKDRVSASDVEISAAADFLRTDIYTFTEIPGPKRKMAWIKYPASCICDDQQTGIQCYRPRSLIRKLLQLCQVSVLSLGHTYRTDSCEFMLGLCVMPNINT